MKEVVTLEDSVVLYHPVIGLRDKRLEDGCCHIGVVEAAQRIADVVEQGAHNIFFIFTEHEHYNRTLRFIAEYDDPAFDASKPKLDLKLFEPMVRNVFAAPKKSLYMKALQE